MSTGEQKPTVNLEAVVTKMAETIAAMTKKIIALEERMAKFEATTKEVELAQYEKFKGNFTEALEILESNLTNPPPPSQLPPKSTGYKGKNYNPNFNRRRNDGQYQQPQQYQPQQFDRGQQYQQPQQFDRGQQYQPQPQQFDRGQQYQQYQPQPQQFDPSQHK